MPDSHPVQPRLLSITGVSQLLGVSRSQVKRLRASGRLPDPIRLGGRVLWRVDEIDAWVQAGCPAASKWRTMRKEARR